MLLRHQLFRCLGVFTASLVGCKPTQPSEGRQPMCRGWLSGGNTCDLRSRVPLLLGQPSFPFPGLRSGAKVFTHLFIQYLYSCQYSLIQCICKTFFSIPGLCRCETARPLPSWSLHSSREEQMVINIVNEFYHLLENKCYMM